MDAWLDLPPLSDQGSSVRVMTRHPTHSLALPQLYTSLSNSSPTLLQRVIISSECSSVVSLYCSKLFLTFWILCHLLQGLNYHHLLMLLLVLSHAKVAFNPDIYGRPCRFASLLIISHHRPHSTNCRLPPSIPSVFYHFYPSKATSMCVKVK